MEWQLVRRRRTWLVQGTKAKRPLQNVEKRRIDEQHAPDGTEWCKRRGGKTMDALFDFFIDGPPCISTRALPQEQLAWGARHARTYSSVVLSGRVRLRRSVGKRQTW